jgi:ADP-ribosyl-[dinitrogen reductase] hydrolase
LAGLLAGAEHPLTDALKTATEVPTELRQALEPIANGETPRQLETSGYVVHTLQTALHDGLFADSAESAIVTAVNRGGDTDTIGAIAGAVAGARFGARGLPERWVATIDESAELENLAEQLVSVA